jgi:Flp pilus assembly protein TadG
MARPTSRRWKLGDAGGVAIEFAMLFPVLMLVIYGIVEFSHYGFTQMTLSDAARSGTRYAVVNGGTSPAPATNSTITTIVRNSATRLTPADVGVVATFVPNNMPGSVAQVDVTYPFTPLLSGVLPPLTLTAQSRMVITR